MRRLGDCRICHQPRLECEGARQWPAGVVGQAIPPAQDQTAGVPPTPPRRTPRGQQRCDIHKGLRQGGEGPTERGHRGPNLERPLDPHRGGGTQETAGVAQKHTGTDLDIAPDPSERIGEDLAAPGDKVGISAASVASCTSRRPRSICGLLASRPSTLPGWSTTAGPHKRRLGRSGCRSWWMSITCKSAMPMIVKLCVSAYRSTMSGLSAPKATATKISWKHILTSSDGCLITNSR